MRLSWTRVSKYRHCPLSFKYAYVEELEGLKNEGLILGELFHELLEKYYKNEDYQAVLKKYNFLVNTGQIDKPNKMFEEVLQHYIGYYADEDAKEKILGIELEIETEWNDGDDIKMVADKIVQREGLNILRDTKTSVSKFKHTYDSVRTNGQLLGYAQVVEAETNISIDAIEIDMIILHQLEKEVPTRNNGMPTSDIRKLKYVTYEMYMAELQNRGLDKEPQYQTIIKKLEERGHPLFKRVLVMLDRDFMRANSDDIEATRKMINFSIENDAFPRNIGLLCNWCEFKDLCEMDMTDPCEEDRDIAKQTAGITKKEKESS